MGGQSSSNTQQTQNSTTAPWAAAQPLLQGILGGLQNNAGNAGSLTSAQSGALDTITNNANQYAGQYTPAVAGVTNSLLNGGGANNQAGNIQQNYQTYQGQMTPLASNTDYNPYNTPGFKDAINTATSDITNNINGSFAAAGRSFSPDNSMALARGLTQGLAPTIANQYNQNVANQQGAANNLFNGGNTSSGLLSALQNQFNANQQQGVGLVPNVTSTANSGAQTTLEAEAQRLGIPLQQLGLLAQIGVPIAGLGSQSTGTATGNTTNQMSGADQFLKIAQGIGSFIPKGPMTFNF